jgi:hypothetical protein
LDPTVASATIDSMELLIAEETALIAFDPENGLLRRTGPGRLDAAIASGLVVECLLLGSITAADGSLIAQEDFGDPLLDSVVDRIRTRGRLLSLKQVVVDLAGRQFGARARVLERLATAGMVTRTTARYLGFIARERYALVDQTARDRVDARLREVLVSGQRPDARTAILVSLLMGAGLLNLVLPRDLRPLGQSRAAAIAAGEVGGQAVSDTLRAAQEAAAAAVPAILSATVVDGGGGHVHS